MLMNTRQQLEQFYSYGVSQLDEGHSQASLSELFDLWLLQQRSEDQCEQEFQAIQESVDDYQNGGRGTDAFEQVHKLRTDLEV